MINVLKSIDLYPKNEIKTYRNFKKYSINIVYPRYSDMLKFKVCNLSHLPFCIYHLLQGILNLRCVSKN